MEATSLEFFDLLNEPVKMNLKGRNKVTPEFNMSSMTDIVFLLLIFFMIAQHWPKIWTLLMSNYLRLKVKQKIAIQYP